MSPEDCTSSAQGNNLAWGSVEEDFDGWVAIPKSPKVKKRCIFLDMHAATLQKLEAFARTVDWAMPHPLHRRKFQKFVLEAHQQGDTRLTPLEIEQAIIHCCGKRPMISLT
jgi:hypothetical protein